MFCLPTRRRRRCVAEKEGICSLRRKICEHIPKGVLLVEGIVGSMWLGLQLRCPACRQGRMYVGWRLREQCPDCGWEFHQKGDGDWLVTWLFAYTLAAVVMVVSMVFMHFFTELDLTTEMIVCALVGGATVGLLFRNCKGMAAGVLYFLRIHWRE